MIWNTFIEWIRITSFWKIHEITSWNEDKFDVVDIIWRTFKAALATILTQKIYVLEIGK
jgi:hypothetical protein